MRRFTCLPDVTDPERVRPVCADIGVSDAPQLAAQALLAREQKRHSESALCPARWESSCLDGNSCDTLRTYAANHARSQGEFIRDLSNYA
jgi:hypothetical protein